VQAAFLDFYFDVCKADVVDIDLVAIGDRNLVEPGPQRRQIVIGELGVDGPREFHARSAPEAPVDRSADLQALLVGQDRFPAGALASAAAPAGPHASVPGHHFSAKSRNVHGASAIAGNSAISLSLIASLSRIMATIMALVHAAVHRLPPQPRPNSGRV